MADKKITAVVPEGKKKPNVIFIIGSVRTANPSPHGYGQAAMMIRRANFLPKDAHRNMWQGYSAKNQIGLENYLRNGNGTKTIMKSISKNRGFN